MTVSNGSSASLGSANGHQTVAYSDGFVSSFQYAPSTIAAPSSRTFQSCYPQSRRAQYAIQDPLGSDVIVLQLGSRFLKLGTANQAFPTVIPHVVAYPSRAHEKAVHIEDVRNDWELPAPDIQAKLGQRHKQSKKKPPPNIYNSMNNYNRAVEPSEIAAHNDAIMLEWTELPARDSSKYYDKILIGHSALNLNPDEAEYELRWPLARNEFNRFASCFNHARDVARELELLWMLAVERELNISRKDFHKYNILLVLPDHFNAAEIKCCLDAVLLGQNPFRAATAMQSSCAVTFGLGVSSGLIIDLGAQSASVACVDEGYLLPDSRVKLNFGGDDITRILAQLLINHGFPYEFPISQRWHPLDWALMENLKESWCTLREEDIAQGPLVLEFHVRSPGEDTKLYRCKVLEERIIAPGVLFDAEFNWMQLVTTLDDNCNKKLFVDSYDLGALNAEEPVIEAEAFVIDTTDQPPAEDAMSDSMLERHCPTCEALFTDLASLLLHCRSDHPEMQNRCLWCGKDGFVDADLYDYHAITSHLQQPTISPAPLAAPMCHYLPPAAHVAVPLDEAVHSSLLSLQDSEKIQRCLNSIIIVGGVSLTPGLPDQLLESLASRLPLHHSTALIQPKLFPNTRDLDPRHVAWKGGAVSSRLETVSEMWIGSAEWVNCGNRASLLKDRFA